MKLHVHEWGTGNKIALLIHGLFASHQNWWRIAPALVQRGYHVLAPDLRGHGFSGRGQYTPELWAEDLIETLPKNADLAIGHSLGGMALAIAAEPLHVQRAIYIDPAWKLTAEQHLSFKSPWRDQLNWDTNQWLQANPRWAAGDITARLESMKTFDPGCIDGLLDGNGHDHMPRTISRPSLVLVADPSSFVTEEDQKALHAIGIQVWPLKGASHSMYREEFEPFMKAIDQWGNQTAG
jgi:pimeloyl-ACP methyl ester carboxylesterase